MAPVTANLQAALRQTAAVSSHSSSQFVVEMQYTGPAERAKQVQADFLECVEVTSFEARFAPTNGAPVQYEKVKEWLSLPQPDPANQKPTSRSLRLLLLPLPTTEFDDAPFGETRFTATSDLFELPPNYLGSFDLQGPNSWFQLPKDDQNRGFIVRMDKYNKAQAAFGLSVAYNPKTFTTTAALRVFLQTELDHVRSRLEKLSAHAWHPLLLPLVLAEVRTHDMTRELAKNKEDLAELEKRAGTYKNQYYADTLDFHSLMPTEGRDFDQILNDLLKIKQAVDYQMFKCQTCLDFLDFMDGLLNEYKDTSGGSPQDKLWSTANEVVKAKLEQQRTWAKNSKERANYVSQRGTALLTACYTLMARNDNWLNLQVAQASKRDSTDMRSIAVLTLVFLPATFVATFFSTGFYDFHVGNNELVSKWYWIFWVVTIVLTALVLFVWWSFGQYLSREEKKRIRQREQEMKARELE